MKPEDHKLKYKIDGNAIEVTVCKNTIYISIEDFQRYLHVKDYIQFKEELSDPEIDFSELIDEYIQHENYLLELSLDHFEKD
jgi:hypothetical protein